MFLSMVCAALLGQGVFLQDVPSVQCPSGQCSQSSIYVMPGYVYHGYPQAEQFSVYPYGSYFYDYRVHGYTGSSYRFPGTYWYPGYRYGFR